MLHVDNIVAGYGAGSILHDVSLHVGRGEIVSILGANGAGKSTLCKVVSGLLRPQSGQVKLAGTDITGMPAYKIARLGVGQVPEGRQIFGNLTVVDNLELAGNYAGRKRGQPLDMQAKLEEIFELFPILRERKTQRVGTMSGGQQQMVALGRALMTQPSLLLLDEPSLGLAPLVVREIFRVIRRLNRDGMSVLLIEQNAYAALQISHRAYVLEHGRVALAGPADEIRQDEQVRFLYLGKRAKEAK